MSNTDNPPLLFDEIQEGTDDAGRRRTAINRCLSFIDEKGVRVVFYWCEPIFRFALSDRLTLRHVAVSLRLVLQRLFFAPATPTQFVASPRVALACDAIAFHPPLVPLNDLGLVPSPQIEKVAEHGAYFAHRHLRLFFFSRTLCRTRKKSESMAKAVW